MMTYWIPDGPCLLPSNATHQVGIGGFVINDKDEVSFSLSFFDFGQEDCSKQLTLLMLSRNRAVFNWLIDISRDCRY